MAEAAVSSTTTAEKPSKRSSRPGSFRLLLNNQLATAGLIVFVLILFIALIAPLLPLVNPDVTNPANRLQGPFSPGHLLGTDELGRDILSRLIWGSQVSIAVGLSATCIAAFFGSLIGLVSGYAGGRVDTFLMRGIDMVMAFPYILLALAIVAVLGPGLLNALVAIAIVNIPFFARNIRGIALGLSRREFVDAARLSGKSNSQILFSEVLPNVVPVIVITMSTTIGWMILETAGLSFLGLGAQPPQADLGSMLGQGRKLLFTAPHVSIIPGLMIFALVMSINLLGDGIRDVLDPRLKSGSLSRPVARTAVERAMAPADTDSGSATQSVLDVQGLHTEFKLGDDIYKAVGGVDYRLDKGECLGIVGESGSGKSVSAMSIMGLVPTPPGRITGGVALLNGEDLFAAPDERIRNLRGSAVSHVFQDPLSSLHPLYRIGDQLVESICAHSQITGSEARKKATELLKMVRIPNPGERLKAYPHELSGGMRQRVCIAMALAHTPEVIIADEPTTALDVTVQAQILSLLDTLRDEQGSGILFITHDFGVVSSICDRVTVMYAGQIVESGTTDEILDSPSHPYTAKLIDCVPVLGEPDRRLDAIDGTPPVVNNLPDGCAFAARCPRAKEDCGKGDIPMKELSHRRGVRCLYPLAAGEQT